MKDEVAKNGSSENNETSVTEEVLQQAGKSSEEVSSVGTIERAEEGDDQNFEDRFRTANSPAHLAVWGNTAYLQLFQPQPGSVNAALPARLEEGIAFVKDKLAAGTLFGEDGRITENALRELGNYGHWGLFVDAKYGGLGLSATDFMRYLTRMASEADASVAGLASIHGCIGAVDPVSSFGSQAQKERFLPRLATGEALSGFALTEPGAGSDLTAVKTTATADGDFYLINGEKLFISNSNYGRTIGLVARLEERLAVFIVELPQSDTDQFQLSNYGLHPLRRLHNHGLIFKNFRVPKENLLVPPYGDGLTIAYHGLNRGRIAVLANCAGVMRILLKSMLPWARYRKTYGAEIASRELVKRRIARGASLIVAADAFRDFSAGLLDSGYRGELECVIAKTFGSEAQFELMMLALRTHGGRSLLKGHLVGDNVFDVLASLIYEGENEILALSFFKSLTKDFAINLIGPILKEAIAQKIDLRSLQSLKPAALLSLVKSIKPLATSAMPLVRWLSAEEIRTAESYLIPGSIRIQRNETENILQSVSPKLRTHVNFAYAQLDRVAARLCQTMLTHMVKLADQQAVMVDDYSRLVSKLIAVLVTCFQASALGDEATILAADLFCLEVRSSITGRPLGMQFRRKSRKMADFVLEGKFQQIAKTMDYEILKQYDQ